MDPPPSIVQTFKYNSSMAQPMFRVVEAPPIHYRSSPPPPTTTKTTTFQDISFSSYLKPKANNSIDDTEISIFDAQKYFSENPDNQKEIMKSNQNQALSPDILSVPRLSSVSSVDGYGPKYQTRSFRAAPTASSEASWNSQTGLLANPPGSIGVSLKNFSSPDSRKRDSVARRWIFGRKCCCTGKNSVQIKEITTSDSDHGPNYGYAKRDSNRGKSQPAISQRSSISSEVQQQKLVLSPKPIRHSSPECNFPVKDHEIPRQQRVSASGGFSFPILDTNQTNKTALKEIKTKMIIVNNPIEDPPRDSLEVFQPMSEIPSVKTRQGLNLIPDDDAGSDASSDLFEIESFSTHTTTSYPMYRRRDSLDEAPTFNARRFTAGNGINLSGGGKIEYGGRRSLDEPPTPSVAATECYAPSEVSIDWSVTTAEGFDRASVSNFSVSASEVGGAAFLRQRMQEDCGGGKRKGNGSGSGGGGGGLLLMSCRQEKAVSVGPQPVKCRSGDQDPPIFPTHVGGRPPRAASKPPLPLAFAA